MNYNDSIRTEDMAMKSIFNNDNKDSNEDINNTLENVRMSLGIDICSLMSKKNKERRTSQSEMFSGGAIKEKMTIEKINAFFS